MTDAKKSIIAEDLEQCLITFLSILEGDDAKISDIENMDYYYIEESIKQLNRIKAWRDMGKITND